MHGVKDNPRMWTQDEMQPHVDQTDNAYRRKIDKETLKNVQAELLRSDRSILLTRDGLQRLRRLNF